MKVTTQKVSFAFARKGDAAMLDTAYGVSANLYDVFTTPPPVEKATLDAAIEAMEDAKAAMVQGGTSATQTRDLRKQELYALLKQLGYYVNVEANNDLSKILATGFEAVSTDRVSEQLPPPEYLTVKNGISRQSLITAKAVKNARGYEMQYTMIDESTGSAGEWIDVNFITSSQNIPVSGLESGKLYIYRVRAMGGLTGHSDWSESVTHRAY